MKKIPKIIIATVLITASLVLSGCSFKSSAQPYAVTLEVWGVFDDTDAYGSIFSDYRKMDPYVKGITYRKLNVDTYKQDLIDALASGKGPDIFLIRNSWVSSFQDKIVAAPPQFGDEKAFRDAFVDVVASDFMGEDKSIYGVPLSVDSLGLYYNKDIFNAAGILNPPATWDEVAQDAAQLSKVDAFGNIVQSGIALGTAYNINRSTDIVTALMLQSGVPFNRNNNQAGNNLANVNLNGAANPLTLYTDFADSRSDHYSWNARQHYSVDAFFEGQSAMMINYSWHYATLKQKNAKLNIATAQLPQLAQGNKANYANYWGYVVAKNKDFGPEVKDTLTQNKIRLFESWQLLRYLTMPHNGSITLYNALSGTSKDFPVKSDPAAMYLDKTQKPAARRDLLETQRRDVILGPFAEGNIIAQNWKQADPEVIETILAEMIDSVNRGASVVQNALGIATNRINNLGK